MSCWGSAFSGLLADCGSEGVRVKLGPFRIFMVANIGICYQVLRSLDLPDCWTLLEFLVVQLGVPPVRSYVTHPVPKPTKALLSMNGCQIIVDRSDMSHRCLQISY